MCTYIYVYTLIIMTIYIFRPNYAALQSKHGALKHKQTDAPKKTSKKTNASALNETQTLIILSPCTALLNTSSSNISDAAVRKSCFMSEARVNETDFCFSKQFVTQEVSGGRKIASHLFNYISLTCLNRWTFTMNGETGSVLNTRSNAP